MLSPRRLIDRHRDHRVLEFARDAIPQIGFPTADLPERLLPAGRVQLLETIEAVTTVAHDFASLGHVTKLLGELQDTHFRFNDLLFSRHALSVSDCQITS